jgi:hypothetical protein
MKTYIFLLFCLIGFSLSACSTNKSNKAKEDSLAAAAAADSMLKEALKADSLKADTDSI